MVTITKLMGRTGYTHPPGNTHSNTLLTVCVNRTRAVWRVGGKDTTRVRGQHTFIRFDREVKHVQGGGGGGVGQPRPCDVRALGMTGWLHYVSETFVESSLKKSKLNLTVLFRIWWKSWDKLEKHIGIINRVKLQLNVQTHGVKIIQYSIQYYF